jgi:hypothetical protein
MENQSGRGLPYVKIDLARTQMFKPASLARVSRCRGSVVMLVIVSALVLSWVRPPIPSMFLTAINATPMAELDELLAVPENMRSSALTEYQVLIRYQMLIRDSAHRINIR